MTAEGRGPARDDRNAATGAGTRGAGVSAEVDGTAIVEALEASRREGASPRSLRAEAVRRIEATSDSYDWVGIYLLNAGELVLDAYVGKPTDHVRIPVGTGVCGTAVAEDRNVVVTDVRELDNYLACSTETRSEIVVLIREPGSGRILGQLDLDSDRVGAFGRTDERELQRVADWLGALPAG